MTTKNTNNTEKIEEDSERKRSEESDRVARFEPPDR